MAFPTPPPPKLPPNWELQASKHDWAFGIAPDGQKYFLSTTKAYPCRAWGPDGINPRKRYIDLKTGVIDL